LLEINGLHFCGMKNIFNSSFNFFKKKSAIDHKIDAKAGIFENKKSHGFNFSKPDFFTEKQSLEAAQITEFFDWMLDDSAIFQTGL
jgi:hypothetical protein